MDSSYMNGGASGYFGQQFFGILPVEPPLFDDSLINGDGADLDFFNGQVFNNNWCVDFVPAQGDSQIQSFPYSPANFPALFGSQQGDDGSSALSFFDPDKAAIPDGEFHSNGAKRGIQDSSSGDAMEDDEDSIARSKPKRQKAIPGGFPCSHCDRTFDRAADLNKHQRRAHTSEDKKPCLCPKCDKRFHYPKDVARHERQIHGPVNALLNVSQHPDQRQSSPQQDRPRISLRPGPDGKPPVINMSTALLFSRSIVMLKGRLRLRRKSTVDALSPSTASSAAAMTSGKAKFVFVTTDKRNFRPLDVAELHTFPSWVEAVRAEFDLPTEQSVSFHRCGLGGEHREEGTEDTQMMATLAKEADAYGTVKFYVMTMTKQEPESP